MSARSEQPAGLPRRSLRRLAAIAVAASVVFAGLTGTVLAFGGQAGNQGNQLTAAPDFVAPGVQGSVVQKAEGGTPGFIRTGGGFRVFANATDTGKPASGIASLNAKLPGRADIALQSGSFSAGGVAYGQRSALVPGATVSAGSYSYEIAAADVAGNSATRTGFGYVVDNTVPTATGIETVNRTAGTAGRPEAGDTVTLTFSEQVDPYSIISDWNGSGSRNVVVRINNNAATGSNDQLVVYDATNATQLPLGSVNLNRNNYVSANTTFGATGTASTMTQSGGTIQIVLGTVAGSTATVSNASTLAWSPSASAFDRAGNPVSTTVANESGASDRNF